METLVNLKKLSNDWNLNFYVEKVSTMKIEWQELKSVLIFE